LPFLKIGSFRVSTRKAKEQKQETVFLKISLQLVMTFMFQKHITLYMQRNTYETQKSLIFMCTYKQLYWLHEKKCVGVFLVKIFGREGGSERRRNENIIVSGTLKM
jgi:hypothetical protein